MSRNTTRFIFLSDAHIKETVFPVQQRVIEWARSEILRHEPDRVVLGGDLTHQAVPVQAKAFIRELGIGARHIAYLPGNNEEQGFCLAEGGFNNISFVRGCESLSNQVFLLETTDRDTATTAINTFFTSAPSEEPCLVFAHFPPELIGNDAIRRLASRSAPVYWISGHIHTGQTCTNGKLTVHTCGGLDPVKVRGHVPELLLVEWDTRLPCVSRVRIPLNILRSPNPRAFPFGLASHGAVPDIMQAATELHVPAVQFNHRFTQGMPSQKELDLIEHYRSSQSESFLSVHLPHIDDTNGNLALNEAQPTLEWAANVGIDNLTVHLPAVRRKMLFDSAHHLQKTPWASKCLKTYTSLATSAIQMNASLSIENMYNKTRPAEPDELLSSRPWHLTAFVENIRNSLLQAGHGPENADRVGVLFDTGHAFRDASVAKIFGLADWLWKLRDYIQLAHVHQVVRTEQGARNHQQITNPCGPLINYQGLIEALDESMPEPIPLLIEVRDLQQALESLNVLRKIQSNRRET